MAAMLETPSRVWRRIEEIEDRDMPSLPSLPPFEDSIEVHTEHEELENELDDISSPMHSTPVLPSIHNTVASTIRPMSSTSSTARFASSIASRSTKSSSVISSTRGISTKKSQADSFDISMIPSLPNISAEPGTGHYSLEYSDEGTSRDSVPEVHLPPETDYDDKDTSQDMSIADALQSVSRTGSPPYHTQSFGEATPKKSYDYSVSLKSEPRPSPFDKYRNVAMRKTAARIRTPSLSRTSSSRTSSPAHSTPQSNKSVDLPESNAGSPISSVSMPLPRSNGASPASGSEGGYASSGRERNVSMNETGIRSMDITDVHISPPQFEHAHPEDEEPQLQELNFHSNEEHSGSQDEREPTFSSDGGGPSPYTQNRHSNHISLTSASSSPAQSIAFTPTPAFPRPRARFNITSDVSLDTPTQTQPHDPKDEDNENPLKSQEQDESPLTPHTRRRSFLLSVINSTARPRLKFPTPHPRHIHNLATPSIIESTPGPASNSVAQIDLRTAFPGVTSRPRVGAARAPRASHPLAQTIIPSPEASEPESTSPASNPSSRKVPLEPWTTPAHSPYDGAGDRASFISTASSHDLTTHHRVNTSFDPAMGFGAGAPGHGVGRFNAGKLNNYLHGLNRRLQEENEALLEKLKKIEEDKKADPTPALVGNGRRLSGGGRRVSAGGTTLENVEEDAAGEGWMEEKAELENMVDSLTEEMAKCVSDKEEVEKALEDERDERTRDKERWRERMTEVEEGVEAIIKELERKVEVAEERAKAAEDLSSERLKELEKVVVGVEGERDIAMERAAKAERILESGKELGGELREANERVGKVIGDLQNANAQIKDLEEEVMRSDARIDDLEKDLAENRDLVSALEEELNAKSDDLEASRTKIHQLEETIHHTDNELHEIKAYVAELEEGASSAIERIESLEDELALSNEKIRTLISSNEQVQEKMEKMKEEAQKAEELARQMEEALEESEKKMWADQEALTELKSKIASIEREREREANKTQESSQNPFKDVGPTDADLEALENELDDANKEIARLTTMLNQSPARKAMDKARDAKIEMLEREKEELLERNRALRMTAAEMNTPNKFINASGISPIHRQVLSMSIRAPRTPGAPLRDMSWLNSASADLPVPPLIAEINRLQHELDLANESIDQKLEKLEDAGLGVIGLTKKLEDARSKISALETEIAQLLRKEERRLHRLERLRCQKCHIKVDFASLVQADQSSLELSRDYLPIEPPTPPTKTSEALRSNLQSVNAQLDTMKEQWEDEKQQLVGEKIILQNAASRLNAQVRNAEEQVKKVTESERAGEKMRAGVREELDRANKAISDLEINLKSERSQIRALVTEQNRIQREKANVLTQLQRTESDMSDIKHQLHKYRQENHDLEAELRENANADQKARLLEARVAENMQTIDQLRQERSLLATNHKELQVRFLEVSEQANQLRNTLAASSTSHDNRRHQLDLQLLEMDDLRRALSDRAEQLQKVEIEKDRVSAEKSDIARTVTVLETDLTQVKKDAEAFGRDLKLLRVEKEKLETKHKDELARMERSKKQTQTQIRLLDEQLEYQKAKASHAQEELKAHICPADEQQLSAIKIQHNKECKGLIVQIRYLKAKFTRESSLRYDLGYQKRYLLELLARLEKSEQTIFASVARIGSPVPPPEPRRRPRRLKSIVIALIFVSRAKSASDLWRQQSSSKHAVAAALQDVRNRRAATVNKVDS